MHGGRHASNYRNVIWIGEAWHRIHSDRGEAFGHQPIEVSNDVRRQTCMYIGRITDVNDDYHHVRPRPLIVLAVYLDLLRMILRGEFEARKQQSQAGGCCKGESSLHCRAPVGGFIIAIGREVRPQLSLRVRVHHAHCSESMISRAKATYARLSADHDVVTLPSLKYTKVMGFSLR